MIVNIANEDRFEIKNKAANYLGRISYGVYMYHMIVINLVLFVFMKLQDKVQIADWIVILMINIISIIALTPPNQHNNIKKYTAILINVVKNPLIIGIVFGFISSYLKLDYPIYENLR